MKHVLRLVLFEEGSLHRISYQIKIWILDFIHFPNIGDEIIIDNDDRLASDIDPLQNEIPGIEGLGNEN